MKRIAIFGGTFNPVHREHVSLCKKAIEELNLDKLIVVPTFMPPHKHIVPAPPEDRLNMLKIAFSGAENIEISDYEIKNGGKSYTYLTVEKFREIYPDVELYFLVGGDMLTDFKTWRYPERILKSVKLAVFSREDFFADFDGEHKFFKERFGTDFITFKYRGNSVSSTEIRIKCALGLDSRNLLPDGVYDYIMKNGVYKGDKYTDFIKKVLPEKRLIHTAGVYVAAMKKAKELSLSEDKIAAATLLHDCAKYMNPSDFPEFSLPDNVPPPVVHQYLGAYVAETVLDVKNAEVLDAIRYHTSGRADMTTLGKLVFVADMVESGRHYEGVEELKKLYEGDFETCFKECLKEEVAHLLKKGQYIYEKTLEAYDYYIKRK